MAGVLPLILMLLLFCVYHHYYNYHHYNHYHYNTYKTTAERSYTGFHSRQTTSAITGKANTRLLDSEMTFIPAHYYHFTD